MSTDQLVLFVSIKPRFAEKILAGEKSVELRRVRPSVAAPGTLVVFYASSPTCEVVGTGLIEAIDIDTPTAIWERHRGELGLPRSEYRSYFAGVRQAVGILLEDVRPVTRRVPLAALRQRLEGFEPPQSFRYIDARQAEVVTS
jgi:predicted transcriptional regulator